MPDLVAGLAVADWLDRQPLVLAHGLLYAGRELRDLAPTSQAWIDIAPCRR